MKFKVYRNDEFICEVDTSRRNEFVWEPVDNLRKDDILVSVNDGARLQVIENNPNGYIRSGLFLKLIEE